MQALELLTPWLTFLLVLVPARYLENWVHRHLYGVGWLLTRDKQQATVFYYLALFPGIFLHEITQWLVAGALNLKLSKISAWPRAQTDGTLRLDFVKLAGKNVNPLLVGGYELAPVLTGIGAVLLISQHIFSAGSIMIALATANLELVLWTLRGILETPDFWLWLYLLFAVGNALLPTVVEQQTRRMATRALIGITLALLVLGAVAGSNASVIHEPVSRLLNLMSNAFASVALLDVLAVAALLILERLLEIITGQKARYPTSQPARVPALEPGGEASLPRDQAPERITARRLPIPPPPKATKNTAPKTAPRPSTPLRAEIPSQSHDSESPSRTEPGSVTPHMELEPLDTAPATSANPDRPAVRSTPDSGEPDVAFSPYFDHEVKTSEEDGGVDPNELYYEDLEDIP